MVVLQFQVALLPEEKPLTLVSDVPAGQLGIWLETSWLGIGLMTDLVSSDPVQVVSEEKCYKIRKMDTLLGKQNCHLH